MHNQIIIINLSDCLLYIHGEKLHVTFSLKIKVLKLQGIMTLVGFPNNSFSENLMVEGCVNMVEELNRFYGRFGARSTKLENFARENKKQKNVQSL